MNFTNMWHHIKELSEHGSRVTGYPGALWASDYIARQLESYGLKIVHHKYKVVVPIEEKSFILINNSLRLNAYAV